MAGKVQIKIDLDSESVEIASDRTLSLAEQQKLLLKELLKTPEGTKEFNILNNTLNDTRDAMERVKVKSQDIYGTLSLLPGPIGGISSSVNQAVDAFKIFGGFKASDLKAQFKNLGADIKDVGATIGKLTGITKTYDTINAALGKTFGVTANSSKVASVAMKGFSAALTATGIGAIVTGLGMLIANFDKVKEAVFNLIPGLKGVADFLGGIVNAVTDFIGVTSQADRNLEKMRKSTDRLNEGLEGEIAILEAQGATAKEIHDKKKQLIENELNFLRETLKQKGTLTEEEAKQFRKLKTDLLVQEAQFQTDQKKQQEEAAKEAAAKAKERADKARQLKQQELDELKKGNEEALKETKTAEENEVDAVNQKYDRLIALAKKYGQDTTNLEKGRAAALKKIADKQAKEKEDKDKKAAEDAKKLAQETADAIAITDEQKYEREKQKLTQHYDELIALNKGNNDAILELEAAKQASLDQMKDEFAAKEYAKTQEQRDIAQQQLLDGLNAELEKRENVRVRDFQGELSFLQQESDARNKAFDDEVAAAQGNADKIKEIEIRRTEFNGEIAEANKKIKGDEEAYKANALAAGLQALDQASEILGKDTVAGKAAAIASTTIRTYESAQKAYTSLAGIPVVGPALAAVAAGVAVAGGLLNVKKIVSTQVPEKPNLGNTQVQGPPQPTGSKFAKGGLLVGPSHSEGGIKSPYGELEGGEFVVNKRSTQSFMPLLSAINSAGNRKYAAGGMTPSINDLQAMMMSQPTPVIKTYVVANEVSSAVEAEHKIAQMARL